MLAAARRRRAAHGANVCASGRGVSFLKIDANCCGATRLAGAMFFSPPARAEDTRRGSLNREKGPATIHADTPPPHGRGSKAVSVAHPRTRRAALRATYSSLADDTPPPRVPSAPPALSPGPIAIPKAAACVERPRRRPALQRRSRPEGAKPHCGREGTNPPRARMRAHAT